MKLMDRAARSRKGINRMSTTPSIVYETLNLGNTDAVSMSTFTEQADVEIGLVFQSQISNVNDELEE